MKEFEKLIEIMETLRGPAGCPWDREQTPEDLKACLLEETYEVLDAIDKSDPLFLREELGDLLLQIVFLSQMAREKGDFQIRDVVLQITQKLVRRHPHVFAGAKLETSGEVLNQWERIKSREREAAGSFLLDGTPAALPALLRAFRLASKASHVGFDWESADGAFEKVEEEFTELREVLSGKMNRDRVCHELGDLMFALANLSRHLEVNPEEALQQANRRFHSRFTHMEKSLRAEGRQVSETDPAELETLWESAKEAESKKKNVQK